MLSPWGRKESDTTGGLNRTEPNRAEPLFLSVHSIKSLKLNTYNTFAMEFHSCRGGSPVIKRNSNVVAST